MNVQSVSAAILVIAGLFFFVLGSIGIFRFPEFYTRLHPAGKVDTLGASLIVLGLVVFEGLTLLAVKVLLVQVFIFLGNPVGSHALGRAALRTGLPWTQREEKSS